MPRTQTSPPGKTKLGDRLWWARRAMGGISQEKLAERGELERLKIQALESGRNKGNSREVMKGLASAFGLPMAQVVDYLDGAYGEPSLAAAQAFIAGQLPESADAPARTIELDVRYPNSQKAIPLVMEETGADHDAVVAAVNSAAVGLSAADDPPTLWWANMAKGYLKVEKRPDKQGLGERVADEDDF